MEAHVVRAEERTLDKVHLAHGRKDGGVGQADLHPLDQFLVHLSVKGFVVNMFHDLAK